MIPNDVPLTAFRSFEHGMVQRVKASARAGRKCSVKVKFFINEKSRFGFPSVRSCAVRRGTLPSSNDCGLSERGGFGLHQDRFFIDSDDIGDLAHLKRDVDSRGLIDRQFELGGKLGKTGHLGRQAVLTRQYGKEGLVATAVCLGG